MNALLFAASRAVRSLFAPGMFSIMIISVIATIIALAGFVTASGFFFTWLAGQLQDGMLAGFLPLMGTVGSALLAWFLFPGIMPVVVNFFGERIAGIIEKEDYPSARPLKTPSFWSGFWHDAGFSAFTIALNILVLPLYLVPVINLFLFYLLNGYLLGREFFVMVGRRHMQPQEVDALRKRHGRAITLLGASFALLATIPLVNLIAPFWGLAAMSHLYHRLAASTEKNTLPNR